MRMNKRPTDSGGYEVTIPVPTITPPFHPGIRPDNQFLQYRSEMSEKELKDYWDKPILSKQYVGYYTFPEPLKMKKPGPRKIPETARIRPLFHKYFGVRTNLLVFHCY